MVHQRLDAVLIVIRYLSFTNLNHSQFSILEAAHYFPCICQSISIMYQWLVVLHNFSRELLFILSQLAFGTTRLKDVTAFLMEPKPYELFDIDKGTDKVFLIGTSFIVIFLFLL